MTPPIPVSIREHQLEGYINALTRLPQETRLFGTESLYGDWNGRCLLLAKDFACSRELENQIASRPRGYSHKPGLRTNIILQRLVKRWSASESPTHCGILYGSALGPLCRADDKMSGTLPNRVRALGFGQHVVRFTIEHMPQLRVIVCLGREAWECVSAVTGVSNPWASARDSGQAYMWKGISIIAAYHPAARVTTQKRDVPWMAVKAALGETHPSGGGGALAA